MTDNETTAEEQPVEESKFVKLLKKSRIKLKKMKHIDGKNLAEHYMIPLIAALYDDMTEGFGDVYDEIDDIEDDDEELLAEALADSPEFIRSLTNYVIFTGRVIDDLYQRVGWIAQNEAGATGFTEKADQTVKDIYQQVRSANIDVATQLKELDELMEAYNVGDDEEVNTDVEPAPSGESATTETPEAELAAAVVNEELEKIEENTTSSPETSETPVEAKIEAPFDAPGEGGDVEPELDPEDPLDSAIITESALLDAAPENQAE